MGSPGSSGSKDLPSPARLTVLFKQRCPQAVQPRHRHLLPSPHFKESYPHQRWQLDTKEGISLSTGRANVVEIRDCYSALMIGSQGFMAELTAKGWEHLHLEQYQCSLRLCFTEWGLPCAVQTDHDGVFANLTDPGFPTLFTLWLVGLGVTHVFSRVQCPTDQPYVERNHRTQGDFVWKDQSFARLTDLQQALDYHRKSYNHFYPSQAAHCHGTPPLSAFPTAQTTGRPYHPDLEWELFDLKRVDVFLAGRIWTRKVASNGIVYLGGNYYGIGKHWGGHTVSIRFLPDARSFSFAVEDGRVMRVLHAKGLEKDQLVGLFPAHAPLPQGFQYALPFIKP